MGFQKFINGYLGIHTDGLKCLNLWQIVAKIIEGIFFKIIVHVTWMSQNQKIFTFGVSKKLRMDTPPHHHPTPDI